MIIANFGFCSTCDLLFLCIPRNLFIYEYMFIRLIRLINGEIRFNNNDYN